MMKRVLLTGASLAVFVASQVHAQDTGAANTTEDAEFIVVTGSRIVREALDSTVPVSTLTAAELTRTGDVVLGDTLNLLPMFRPTFSTQNSGRFIGTAGVNALDLRGQGTARTLVLQNGRRHVTSQPGQNTVDVNAMPTDLVERVDVVTGGNSAIYGSDAIAGVVNFITKRDFEGIRARGQIGISSRGDRPTYFGSLTAGKNFNEGRGNVAVSLEYSQTDALYFRDREFAGAFSGRTQFQLTENTAFSGPGQTPEPAAGNGIFDTTLLTGLKNAGLSLGGAITSTCAGSADRRALNCSGVMSQTGINTFTELGNIFVFQPDGSLTRSVGERDFRPFGSGNFLGGQGSTLREVGLLATGNTRYSANLLASYEVSDGFRPFIEAKFVRTDSLQEGQPTFSSGALNPTFSINNPFLTTQARDLLVRSLAPGATGFTMQRFNVDFGARGENHQRDLYRVVVGADGSFLDSWRYEVAFNYGRVNTNYATEGNVALARFTNAVNAVRNTSGQIVCSINADANTGNDDPNCVPINLFGVGAPSQAALNYITHTSTREQWAEQLNAIAYVSGDSGKWFELPGGPIGFSVGGEWRQEKAFAAYDEFTRGGGTFLNAIANFEPPKLTVWDAFSEIRLPILADRPFFNELTVEGAARVSNYNVGATGTVWAFNVGGIWSPVEGARIRGGWARSVRAPTMSDLFASQSETFLNGLVDPCGQQNINNNPNRVANCAAGGVPTTQTFNGTTEPFTNRPTSGIVGFNGGNPDLFEERANSWTVGGVLTPSFLPGLIVSVDYFNIDLKDAINTIGAQTVINQCYDSPDGIDNVFCDAITRNPNGTFAGQTNVNHGGAEVSFARTGSSFLQGPFNYARQKTSGIDFDIGYTYPSTGDWSFSGRLLLSYIIERTNFTSVSEPDRETRIKSTLGDPEWNGQVNVNVGYTDWNLQWTMRFFSKQVLSTTGTWNAQNVEQERPPTNADQFPEIFYPGASYHDFRLQKTLGRNMFYVGVDNLFDKMPTWDLTGTAAGDSIFTNTGRFFYVGIDLKFQ